MRKTIVVIAVLLAAFACKKSETATSTTTQTTSTTATTAPPPAQPATSTTATTASTAPTAGAIAGTDGEKPGTHIDITELKRASGGTVNLKFTVANNGSEALGLWGSYFGDSAVSHTNYKDVSGIHLLDPVNKKKYFVVTDTERNCVCSKELNPDKIEPGAKMNLWAKFPAPPPEVTKVTIEIPHFQPIDDVPISQ